MKNGKLGYGVIGLGVGMAHTDAAAKSENCTLVAVCDIDESRLKKAAERYPYIKTYVDFEDMLRDEEIDIISICLPSAMHADFAVRAMEAGKHVLVEKPIDITLEAAKRIEEARIRTGKVAGVVHQNRNNAVMKPIKAAVEAGRLGKTVLGTFAVKWYRDAHYYDGWHGTWEMDGGGSLMNQAVHTVDLMQWLMGEVESVHSTMGIYNHDIETEDLTASVITFKSGAAATFVSTTCAYPGLSTDIQLYGTGGAIEADADILKRWVLRDSEDADEEEEEMLERYSGGNRAVERADSTVITGHASVVEDFLAAVREGRPPMVTPCEAMKSVRIVNAIYESARTGKTVYFD